jgi:hypothetical protein
MVAWFSGMGLSPWICIVDTGIIRIDSICGIIALPAGRRNRSKPLLSKLAG